VELTARHFRPIPLNKHFYQHLVPLTLVVGSVLSY
jgi:hypothetical protein